MNDKKPLRFELLAAIREAKASDIGSDLDKLIWTGLTAIETLSLQLDYLIDMMYGQKQKEHFAEQSSDGAIDSAIHSDDGSVFNMGDNDHRLTEYDGSFIRYLLGIPTGSFLQYILENNLMGAIGHADSLNRYRLWDICNVVYNELPSRCHGSESKVRAWFNLEQQERIDYLLSAKDLPLCDRAIELHEDIQKRKEEA